MGASTEDAGTMPNCGKSEASLTGYCTQPKICKMDAPSSTLSNVQPYMFEAPEPEYNSSSDMEQPETPRTSQSASEWYFFPPGIYESEQYFTD